MSASPNVLPKSRNGQRMGNWELVDTMIQDGLWCAFNDCHMGITAENIVAKYEFSRAEQDLFAATSQQRTEAAQNAGHFDAEIIPVEIPQRKGAPVVFAKDEFPRAGTTAESLAKLKPAFKKDGTVTAGNASGINDGAFRKMSEGQWNAVLSVNLDSVFNVTRQFIDGMLNKGWGRVVNISSINGQKGQFGQTNYSAAKAGMHGFTMALAQETAKKGITVNSVRPAT